VSFCSPFEKLEIVLKTLSDRFGEQNVVYQLERIRQGSLSVEDVQPWIFGFLLRKIKLLFV